MPSQRDGSGTWEIGTDDDCDAPPVASYHHAIPMYNPQHHAVAHPAPRSYPSAWQKSYYSSPDLMHDSAAENWNPKKTDLPSLAPAFIPDSRYATYLRTGRHASGNIKKGGALITKVCCAKFCAGFSFVAVGFLLFVGIIFDTQPLYIPGSLPKHLQYVEGSTSKTQVVYSITPSVRLLPASNAYGAALFYLITGCCCVAYAYDLISCYRRKWYDEIPDADSTVPTFNLPTRASFKDFALPIAASPNRTRAYYPRGAIPDGFMDASRFYYNRARIFLASAWHANDSRRTRKRKADPKEV
jgi:hypothetical protein